MTRLSHRRVVAQMVKTETAKPRGIFAKMFPVIQSLAPESLSELEEAWNRVFQTARLQRSFKRDEDYPIIP